MSEWRLPDKVVLTGRASHRCRPSHRSRLTVLTSDESVAESKSVAYVAHDRSRTGLPALSSSDGCSVATGEDEQIVGRHCRMCGRSESGRHPSIRSRHLEETSALPAEPSFSTTSRPRPQRSGIPRRSMSGAAAHSTLKLSLLRVTAATVRVTKRNAHMKRAASMRSAADREDGKRGGWRNRPGSGAGVGLLYTPPGLNRLIIVSPIVGSGIPLTSDTILAPAPLLLATSTLVVTSTNARIRLE